MMEIEREGDWKNGSVGEGCKGGVDSEKEG